MKIYNENIKANFLLVEKTKERYTYYWKATAKIDFKRHDIA